MRRAKILLSLLVMLALGLASALGLFSGRLTVPEAPVHALPAASPPPSLRVLALPAGRMFSRAGLAYSGGSMFEERIFAMGGILVQHPQGSLLFDTGFGRQIDAHAQRNPWLMRATSRYEKQRSVAEQLDEIGIAPRDLKAVVLTHAHWDHVSGLDDLREAPVWLSRAEFEHLEDKDDPLFDLVRSFGPLKFEPFDFPHGPYLGFTASFDVFGDGSVVLVPAPGHSPGSIIVFLAVPSGTRYALIGDIVWQREGIDLPAERPWIARSKVDWDADRVRDLIIHLHRLQRDLPELIMIPAHDQRAWTELTREIADS